MPEIPPSPQDDLIRLSLWSRDRFGVPQAVVSGPSALAVYELSDLIPSKVHLTVPPTFRKAAPKGAVLQRARLAPQDVIEHEGYSVTSPLRTLLDVAAEGAVSTEQLVRAAADALEAGLVRRSALQDAAEREPAAARLLRLLDQR
jgi:predicted transcriptional regulator of viral defense system